MRPIKKRADSTSVESALSDTLAIAYVHHTVSPDTNDIERLLPGLLGAVVGAADDLWCCDAVHRTPGQRTPSYRPRTREEDVMSAPDHHFQKDHKHEAPPIPVPLALLLVVGSVNVAATVFSLLAA